MKNLLEIMARLRDPETGCPWDLQQDFRTIAPYTIEEAFEVAEAIEQGDPESIREELGDLLFQVVFHAQMARERQWFSFDEVVEGICAKMVRRHPHVFGDEPIGTAQDQNRRWEAIKQEEKGDAGRTGSFLDGVTRGLPPMARAVKLQKRAARAGFDWPEAEPVADKVREELSELESEMNRSDDGVDPARLEEELGDLLFAVTNLARKLEIDPGAALRRSNRKFEDRFRAMEVRASAQGRPLEELDLEEQENLWGEVKAGGFRSSGSDST